MPIGVNFGGFHASVLVAAEIFQEGMKQAVGIKGEMCRRSVGADGDSARQRAREEMMFVERGIVIFGGDGVAHEDHERAAGADEFFEIDGDVFLNFAHAAKTDAAVVGENLVREFEIADAFGGDVTVGFGALGAGGVECGVEECAARAQAPDAALAFDDEDF